MMPDLDKTFKHAITAAAICLVLAVVFVARIAYDSGYKEAWKEAKEHHREETQRALDMQLRVVREIAIERGHGEYYLDENHERKFRWIPAEKEGHDGQG